MSKNESALKGIREAIEMFAKHTSIAKARLMRARAEEMRLRTQITRIQTKILRAQTLMMRAQARHTYCDWSYILRAQSEFSID